MRKNHKHLKTDQKDARIISELVKDCRQPLSVLSKKTHLSRDVVAYRIKEMQRKRIIDKFMIQVDTSMIGFESYHFFFRMGKRDPEEEKALLEKLSALHYTRAIIRYYGHYDYEIVFLAQSNRELDAHCIEMKLLIGERMRESVLLPKIRNLVTFALPKKYLYHEAILEQEDHTLKFSPDETDLKIIRALNKDARKTSVMIAAETKVSVNTVILRIKRMKESGFIYAFRPSFNFEALGLGVYCILLNTEIMEKAAYNRFKQLIRQDAQIFFAARLMGQYDYMLYIAAEEIEDVYHTVELLKEKSTVNSFDVLFSVKMEKFTYAPEVLFRQGKAGK